jgi:23S rRNA (guanosine2251-2'-O)-methyltransferase
MKKPKWVIKKEKDVKNAQKKTYWIFGLHAVRDALVNQKRKKIRLMITTNAAAKLPESISISGLPPEIFDARQFKPPIEKNSVHQGAALEVESLQWGSLEDIIMNSRGSPPCLVLLDQVTDPHNVGAILRSAEVFGASAVVGTKIHSPSETGALAKSASGALERQPYIRIRNLADTIQHLEKMGFICVGLDGEAENTLVDIQEISHRPTALVLGSEGSGLRFRTKQTVKFMVKIPFSTDFGSLNVSNAAAIALYQLQELSQNSH